MVEPNNRPGHAKKSVYPSKVDAWIAALLIAGPAVCVVMTIVLLQRGLARDATHCVLAGAFTLLVTGIFTVPCRYTILKDSLTIRCGLLFFRVPINQIRNIEKSGSWISGPALSLQRVKVSTSSRFYLISPDDRDRFIAELEQAVADCQGSQAEHPLSD